MKNPLLGPCRKANRTHLALCFLAVFFVAIFFTPFLLNASEVRACTIISGCNSLQPIINSLNTIIADTNAIQDIVTTILNDIGGLSVDDQLILSQLDIIESLIENLDPCSISGLDTLENQISVGNAQILSALEQISPACIPITTATSISNPGTYCLQNEIAGSITVSNRDIVLDLNGFKVDGGIVVNSHNITIQNGTVQNVSGDAIVVNEGTNITISHVRVESSAGRGINLIGVMGGLVEYCELVQNATGIEFNGASEVEINNTVARSNLYSGFSLAASFTNTIRNCMAINSGQGNNQPDNNNVYGFVAQNSSSNIFENCIANATQALSTTDYNSIVAGFALTGDSNCNKILDCESANAITSLSGFTVPYGILLQGTFGSTLTLTAVPSIPVPSGNVYAVQWSPDRRYIATGSDAAPYIQIYAFDTTNGVVQQIAVPDQMPEAAVYTLDWSADGKYLAAGMDSGDADRVRIYAFDSTNNSLIQVATPNPLLAPNVYSVRWSHDGKYLAIGTQYLLGGNSLFVYNFDRVNNTLTLLSTAQPGFDILAVDWSGDGLYIAAGLTEGASVFLRIYPFIPMSQTLGAPIESDSDGTNPFDIEAVRWSPDCSYIAAGGQNTTSQGIVNIYQFNAATTSSSASVTFKNQIVQGATVYSVDWSGDGRYIVAGYNGTNSPSVFSYDRGANVFTTSIDSNISPGAAVQCVAWSPDGQYIVVSVAENPSDIGLYIYNALSFPSDNIVKDNIVYCNSGAQCPNGVGICGSSICNYIVGNTVYSNPINPSMASSNYQFVCNVFNQLFGDAPTLLQNIALGSCEPIAIPDNVGLLVKQETKLLNSQMDSVSAQVSADDAQILTALYAISGSSLCAAIPIKNATNITTAGFYCLANNVTGTITVDASNVVIDLNNNTVTGFISLGAVERITIQNGTVVPNANDMGITANGTKYLTVSNILVSGNTETTIGISLTGVTTGLIEHCQLVDSVTGLLCSGCSYIRVNKSSAINNTNIGFLFSGDSEDTIRDCQAINTGVNNISTIGAQIYGFVAQLGTTGNIFENCIANATQAPASVDSDSMVAGFALLDTSNNNKIIGCEAANATTDPSGFTIPYGIYLEAVFNELTSVTAVGNSHSGDTIYATAWSSDGIYLAVGGVIPDDNNLVVYQFNRTTQALVQLVSVTPPDISGIVNAIAWSLDGQYLAVGTGDSVPDTFGKGYAYLYQFDKTAQTLTLIQVLTPNDLSTNVVEAVSWSPDGQYLAVGGYFSGPLSPSLPAPTETVYLYQFDRVTQMATYVDSVLMGYESYYQDKPSAAYALSWSPDGQYLAVGGQIFNSDRYPDHGGDPLDTLYLYRFDRGSQSLVQVDSALPGDYNESEEMYSAVDAISWSSDGNYLAIGGEFVESVLPAGAVYLYQFDITTQTLVQVLSFAPDGNQNNISSDQVRALSWSPDGYYLALCGSAIYDSSAVLTNAWYLYTFDRATSTVDKLASTVPGSPNTTGDSFYALSWSPDGQYLTVGGTTSGSADVFHSTLFVYSVLAFPSENVIKDNTVYCNSGGILKSGVGISGSSICNYIVGNTAYSNPINPPIVSTNYQFVCNVFNPAFGNEPSLLQNISLGSCEPIAIPDNVSLLVKQNINLLTINTSLLAALLSKLDVLL